MEIRRPLKRNLPKLGPPDIYPQDPRQKEDELTSINVKHGYTSAPLVSGPHILDEFSTAKHANVDAFGVYFSALLSEKHRINTIKDTQKKKFVNTKEIWYVHAKTKNAVDNWFRDLANGTKSLGQLGKRIPIFNSKEGIFSQLYESRVPFTKAVWFIKMSAVHANALSESSSKSKKRQIPDQYQELTTALTRYLKDILFKIFECNQQALQSQTQQHKPVNQDQSACQSLLNKLNTPKLVSQKLQSNPTSNNSLAHHIAHLTQNPGSNGSISSLLNDQTNFTNNLHTSVASLITSHMASVASLIASSAASLQVNHDEFIPTYNQWQYQTQLARYLFDEGLLDRYDFLCFLLELMEKKRPLGDLVIKLICPFALEYVVDFSKSAVLSRRLAHVCAKKLSQALAHNSTSPSDLHSNVIYILSSIIQVICIECPTAMVRHNIVDSKFPAMYQGSPLDNLPCLPSNLPMMDLDLNLEFKRTVHEAEREILFRSAMSDSKWSCTSSRRAENSKSVLVDRLLTILTTLDNHNFDKIDSINSFDTLYSKIFPGEESTINRTTFQTNTENTSSNSNINDSMVQNLTINTSLQQNNLDHGKKSKHHGLNTTYLPNIDICDDLTAQNNKSYEEQVVRLLCEWASTTQRTGEHRGFVVGRLLERRQTELQFRKTKLASIASEKKTDDLKSETNGPHLNSLSIHCTASEQSNGNEKEEDKEDIIEYVFQDMLVQFLDENAPIVEENQNDDPEVEKVFNNLVMLFGELIRCDVFSHYNYMCTLISRGMFNDLSISNKTQPVADNHIDDVDADLGNLVQVISKGQQDEPGDLLLPDFHGGSREDSGTKNKLSPFGISDRTPTLGSSTPGHVMSTSNFPPSSVEPKSIGITTMDDEKSCLSNPSEHRHMIFVKHFPVPDDENFARDINQRNILLHGFAKEREEARHSVKKLNKEICKLLSRRASRDINDGGKIKKIATRDCFNPEATLHKFEVLNSHDQHLITNSLSVAIVEMFTGVSNGQTSSLPTLESVSFIFDLFSMSSNISGLLDLIVPILEELPDVEAQIKLKCPSLSNQYTYSVALCIVGLLYRYHNCVLLLTKEEICSIFESLYKLVAHIQNPGICMTSAERVIFAYLHDLYTSYLNGKSFSQYTWLVQKIKQQLWSAPAGTMNLDMTHDWTPTFLTNIVAQLSTSTLCSSSSTNPILNASSGISTSNSFGTLTAHDLTVSIRQQLYSIDSPMLRQMNEIPSARYRFVCDAFYLSATSTSTDIVNDIAVLCADLTAKCPAFMNDWISALQALLCSVQGEHSYRQILDKINITDPQVKDNIAIFVAILVARRCIQLNEFMIKCAIGTILHSASYNPTEKHPTDPGVRLTCHLLLALFRNRESTGSQSRCNQAPLYNSHSAFGQTFSTYGSSLNSYGNGILGSVGMLPPPNMSKDYDGNCRTLLSLKYLCDHHLLRSACLNLRTECHITLLKAIRLLAISSNPTNDLDLQNKLKPESHYDDLSVDGLSQMSRDGLERRPGSPSLLDRDLGSNQRINLQTASLHHFADAILRLLCSLRWLHDKCLSDSDIFTTIDNEKNILLDPRMDVKQSQRLLYMICYNKSPEMQADVGLDDQGSDQVASIVKMFESLDVWSMRLSLMRLQFMFAYCKSQSNVVLNDWLDNLAKAVVEFFQKSSQESDTSDKDNEDSGDSSRKSKCSKNSSSTANVTRINKVWLVEPLLNKLAKPPNSIQSKIIKASAALMESASVRANSLPSLNQTYLSTAAASTKFKERTLSQRGSASTNPSNLASTSLLGFEPYLSLLLSCLKNQDKERETLLTSLNSQLYQAIHEKVDDIGYKQSLQDGLELRLCLIGQMFDTIQRSPNLTSDWATLLLLLIMNNLVDPQLDYGLYVSVLDMLAMLIQSAYASDPIEQKENVKKQYQNLMKKFRKELAALEEKGFIQMKLISPLMPLVRPKTEVITCEPMGSLVDTKGEKVENFYSIDKKKGLKVSELQEVSPWELIEGHKNPHPLLWPWFGAIKMEYKPLKADENNRLMSWHTHTMRLDTGYYGQTPNIEDGPSGNKRMNSDKKPSQSNPLLKSLIEAKDDNDIHPFNKRDVNKSNDEDTPMDDLEWTDQYMSKHDLLEDYCELPVDFLFDSAPVETMIDEIKAAMQADDAAANRAKSVASTPVIRPIVETKPVILPQPSSQASSILAPVQTPLINELPKPATPVSALSALQNHLNAPVVTPPEQKQKAPRKKRATKKETLAQQQQLQHQQQQQQQQQSQPHQPPIVPPRTPSQPQAIRSSEQMQSSPMSFQPMSHQSLPVSSLSQAPQMQVTIQTPQHHMQQQQTQQQQPTQHMQQQPSHQMLYQTQAPMQHGTHGQHLHTNQQARMPDHHQQSQMNYQPMSVHQQHPMGTHISSGQSQMSMQQPHQHIQQQHIQQQQQQHHPHHQIQYISQQQPQQQQLAQRQHQMNTHQQHMQPQSVRIGGHQQPMQFQQMQLQPPQQHQQQQQIFAPQQAAGHSRPALTAMLHQKHAAAGNLDTKLQHPAQPRFNYN